MNFLNSEFFKPVSTFHATHSNGQVRNPNLTFPVFCDNFLILITFLQNCFNSPIYSKAADSYISPKDELARGSSKTKGEGEGGNDGNNEYIPIRSKLGEVQLKGDDEGQGVGLFKEKDSPQAFTTTPFPYQVGHFCRIIS